MNLLSGRVLELESGLGIRDLLVVAYDVDAGAASSFDEFAITHRESPETIPPSFWSTFPGQRLGSVLTGPDGGFRLIYRDDLFSYREPDDRIRRPDLVLFVMAPEDSQSDITPWPAPQRILHWSNEVRRDAGRLESALIRIPRGRLEKYRLAGWAGGLALAPEAMAGLVAARDAQTGPLAAARRERRRERIEARAAIAETIKERVLPTFLSTASPEARAAGDVVSDLSDLASVREARGKVLDRFIRWFYDPQAPPSRALNIERGRPFRFRLTGEEARKLGLTIEGQAIHGSVAIAWLRERYAAAASGTALLAGPSHLTSCLRERAVDEAMAWVLDESPAPPPEIDSTEPPPAYELSASLDRVFAPGAPGAAGQPGELSTVAANVGGFALPPGPADVTSIHEFHDLQIALPHVWAELFDDVLVRKGRELYAGVVQAQGDLGLTETDREIAAMEDLDELRRFAEEIVNATIPPHVQRLLPELTHRTWRSLEEDARATLEDFGDRAEIAEEVRVRVRGERPRIVLNADEDGRIVVGAPDPDLVLDSSRDEGPTQGYPSLQEAARTFLAATLREAEELGKSASGGLAETLADLARRLGEPHKFDVFAPDTMNFGLVVTYHQAWRPVTFQVGDLVKTIPLAPGETREYSVKRVEKTSRNRKEVQDNLRIKKEESEEKGRVESEVVSKAAQKSNWKVAAEGSGGIAGVFNVGASASFEGSAEAESSAAKKAMRESVKKAAEEYRQENKLEIESSYSSELTVTETAKVSNPNQEITVTYLFYELQRRFAVSEKIARVQPVVMVANAVPAPHQVDEAFLIAHDWVIRRALLDDQFLAALDYLAGASVGDEFALKIMRSEVKAKSSALDALSGLVRPKESEIGRALGELAGATQWLIDKTVLEDEKRIQASRIKEQSVRETLDRLDRELTAIRADIDRVSTELTAATERYVEALRQHLDLRTEVERLRVHVASHILHYMQAIWDTEPPDQRYFRLYQLRVVDFGVRSGGPRPVTGTLDPLTGTWRCVATLLPPGDPLAEDQWPTLGEVADLDAPLGYKGNYLIFPLRRGNALTDFMAQAFVNEEGTGVGDPDEAGNLSLDELVQALRCLRQGLHGGTFPGDAEAEARRLLASRLDDPYRHEEEIVVPTDSLFIEALPGTHAVLEGFKLAHRAIDVRKAAAEARRAELEALRLAERLLSGDRSDPDVDRYIVVDGQPVLPIVDTDGE
jgi:hypothetical protein